MLPTIQKAPIELPTVCLALVAGLFATSAPIRAQVPQGAPLARPTIKYEPPQTNDWANWKRDCHDMFTKTDKANITAARLTPSGIAPSILFRRPLSRGAESAVADTTVRTLTTTIKPGWISQECSLFGSSLSRRRSLPSSGPILVGAISKWISLLKCLRATNKCPHCRFTGSDRTRASTIRFGLASVTRAPGSWYRTRCSPGSD